MDTRPSLTAIDKYDDYEFLHQCHKYNIFAVCPVHVLLDANGNDGKGKRWKKEERRKKCDSIRDKISKKRYIYFVILLVAFRIN